MISKRQRSEIGRQLAAFRSKVKLKCQHCGASFTGIKNKKYCSDRCRMAASRQRKAEG